MSGLNGLLLKQNNKPIAIALVPYHSISLKQESQYLLSKIWVLSSNIAIFSVAVLNMTVLLLLSPWVIDHCFILMWRDN